MNPLAEDLERYYNEAYYRRDLKAGLKLIQEVLGMVTIGGLLISALFVWLPGIGIPITTVAAIRVIQGVTQCYSQLDAEERKQVRGVVRWLNGSINLLD
ncbi:MAG: hypothetical protein DHS20C17_35560 [Cyclobacteriaceae bacterium]|nr:MAG: hypothetical protein DHS20C17_35560 [Cyclobacteriaceae bacterium]